MPSAACIALRERPMNYREHIEIVTGKRSGKACIKGTRIAVYDVLEWLASGMSQEEIIADYPELTVEQISACLLYAADREHRLSVVPAA